MIDLSYPWLPAHDVRAAFCFLCGGNGATETAARFSVNGRSFWITRCVKDDLYFTDPRGGEWWTQDIYNRPDYYTSKDPMYGVAADGEAVARLRVAEILARVPDASSLLEVGPGPDRHVLIEAADRGFSDTLPVDDFQKVRVDRLFDVAAAWSVLEHVQDPLALLDFMAHCVFRDGAVVIRIPIVDAHGPWLSLLDHVWHFTEASAAATFARAGLSVTDAFPSGAFVHGKDRLESKTFFLKVL